MTTRGEALARDPDRNTRMRGPDAEHRVLMTLRVSRDSGRTWGQLTEVWEVENPVIPDNPIGFPPCTCPRCTDQCPHSEASPGVES